jgi:hypothetical protein
MDGSMYLLKIAKMNGKQAREPRGAETREYLSTRLFA